MTREELRVFLDSTYGCMCGLPEQATFALYLSLVGYESHVRTLPHAF